MGLDKVLRGGEIAPIDNSHFSCKKAAAATKKTLLYRVFLLC
jgi:hypothetical protein